MDLKDEEVYKIMDDLLEHDCDVLTIGQYLQPSSQHLEVKEFVPPSQFKEWQNFGESIGFLQVVSTPLTRSSYHAEQVQALMKLYPRAKPS